MRVWICLSGSFCLGCCGDRFRGLTVCMFPMSDSVAMCYDSSVHITDQWMLRLDWY